MRKWWSNLHPTRKEFYVIVGLCTLISIFAVGYLVFASMVDPAYYHNCPY